MIRNKELMSIRVEFVKLAIKDPKKAAKNLNELAEGLGNTKSMNDTVFALTQIFGVSEKTIMRDLLNDTL